MTAMEMKTVLIMAGGTGGHIFPALAVAEELQLKGARIEWLGTRKGLEARLVPEHHYPINYIDIGGLRGKGVATMILLPIRLLKALMQTFTVYKKIKPNVVLGMGGFVTGPGGVVAWLMGKPLVLHEQNAIPGLTNKILFSLAKKVFAAFPGAFKAHKKLSIIGNPVRKEIVNIAEPEQRSKGESLNADDLQSGTTLKLLIIGGSLGATALNERVPEALEWLSHHVCDAKIEFEAIHVRHQCGEKHVDATRENYQWLERQENDHISVQVLPFIKDMAANYQWADLVICRSGALTVSEIAAAGVASLLVPYPYAVDDHQTANAAYLANEGAAFLVQQKELDKERLAEILMKLDSNTIGQMAIKARQLAITHAAQVVAEECLELAG